MSSAKRKLDSEHLASREQPKRKAHKLDDYNSNSLYAHSCDVNSDNNQTTISTKHHHADKPFRFLNLAAELRNSIYSFTLDDYPVRISKDSTLQTDCPLLCVSKQFNSEVKSLLTTSATTIETTVRYFNFNHVITFFDSLSSKDFRDLSASSCSGCPSVKITLASSSLMDDWSSEDEIRDLARWWQWVYEAEAGVAIEVSYDGGRRSAIRGSWLEGMIGQLRGREEAKKRKRDGLAEAGRSGGG